MSESYRKQSRKEWIPDGVPSLQDIQIGCLQRIADACELMAKDHQNLLNRERWANERAEGLKKHNEWLGRSNAALRGVIKRMKRAADSAKEE